jgi:kynurenine formamidase
MRMNKLKNINSDNWGRWKNNLGTLNLITPAVVINAVKLVKSGIVIPCSRPLNEKDTLRSSPAFSHKMMYAQTKEAEGNKFAEGISQAASDEIFIRIHGMMNTHIDAFCHVGVDDQGFNGIPWDEMVSMEGGHIGTITDALTIVTRGVLIDIPRLRNTLYMEAGEALSLEELQKAAPEIQKGDALLIRTGRWIVPEEISSDRQKDPHGNFAGLHPNCGQFLAENEISVFGMDGGCDVFPALSEYRDRTIHIQCLTKLGIHLIHNLDLEVLADTCRKEKRNTFLFIVSSLNIPKGTGSPTTPIAIF